MGKLRKAKCTLIGAIEDAKDGGTSVRDWFNKVLHDTFDITFFHHGRNPLIEQPHEEGPEFSSMLKRLLKERKFEELEKYKYIRSADLGLIDKSDFVIFDYNPKLKTCGSFEEFFLANKLKKPIFVLNEQGIDTCPVWMFWTIPHKYFYESREDLIEMIRNIDNGSVEIDSSRWRLLKPEYR